uniref:Odorant receptor n=1 Tax=Phlebotomus papatasi TaxID=29031 RepID=A0A3F2ZEP0_PHLPP
MFDHNHLEYYTKIESKLQFGIAITTFYATNEPLIYRLLIKFPIISNMFCLLFSTLHIANTFQGQFTGNLAMSIVFITACIQTLSKGFVMRHYRNNMLKLLDKVQSLYNNFENKDINCIAEKNLAKFSNIWATYFKYAKTILILATVIYSIGNVIKGKSGILIQLPLIPINFPYYNQIVLFIQFLICTSMSVYSLNSDISIAFFGFEIMAASDILYDYISTNKDRIQEDPDFLKIITIRYCEVVNNIKRFNDIISLANLVQFVTSAFLSFAIFFFIRLYPKNPVGYIIASCILFQLFIPCLFGEFIKIKMERLSTTLYLTNWPDLNLKDQKSFVIVLGMTQKKYGLRAAGMYDVNIYTFIEIMKMATSWCAFMFTLEATIEKAG